MNLIISLLALSLSPASARPPLSPGMMPTLEGTLAEQAAFREAGLQPLAAEPDGAAVTFELSARAAGSRGVHKLALDGRTYDVGIAGTKGFAKRFIVLEDGASMKAVPLSDFEGRMCLSGLRCFRGKPFEFNGKVYFLDVAVAASENSSTLRVMQEGAKDPVASVTLGTIAESLRAGRTFTATLGGGQEVGMMISDVIADDGSGFTGEKTFLFIRKKVLGYDGWPVFAPDLAPGRWFGLTLDDRTRLGMSLNAGVLSVKPL